MQVHMHVSVCTLVGKHTYVHTVDIYVYLCAHVDIIECNSTLYVGISRKNGSLYHAYVYYAYIYYMHIATVNQVIFENWFSLSSNLS